MMTVAQPHPGDGGQVLRTRVGLAPPPTRGQINQPATVVAAALQRKGIAPTAMVSMRNAAHWTR